VTTDDEVPEPVAVVDARGLRCPLPVLELARQVGDLPEGAVVELLADDPATDVDVPAWCALRGATFLGSRPASDGGTSYLVTVPR
jgi:TusA-related sulfurtransferase